MQYCKDKDFRSFFVRNYITEELEMPVDTMVCLLWAYKTHRADGKIFTSRFFLPYTLSPLL